MFYVIVLSMLIAFIDYSRKQKKQKKHVKTKNTKWSTEQRY